MQIAMIGAGAWGIAMARSLVEVHPNVCLYARNAETVAEMTKTRQHAAYLPGVLLPNQVKITADLEAAVTNADVVVLATPSKAIGTMAEAIRPWLLENALVISAAKGLSPSGGRLSEDIRVALAGVTEEIAVISGPNHAEEVGRLLPAATVVAAARKETAMRAQDVYMLPHLRAYYSTDIFGVEYGGALKNIIALAAGAVDGVGYGDNTRATLITRGLAEIVRYAAHFGARNETLFGLSGMGDLIVTCTSKHSRNHEAGRALAQGLTETQITQGTKKVVEGIRSTHIVYPVAQREGIEMPITEQVYRVLSGESLLQNALQNLMTRAKKEEHQEPVIL